eukprot:2540015-Lingulodinium_polyedra.AAC.1
MLRPSLMLASSALSSSPVVPSRPRVRCAPPCPTSASSTSSFPILPSNSSPNDRPWHHEMLFDRRRGALP